MSMWDEFQMEAKVLGLLDIQPHDPDHHFGRPFLTPYQIAIVFRTRYPTEFQLIGKPVGGKGTGQQDSLAQYIALELSRRIRDGHIRNVEGAFLARQNLRSLEYEDGGQTIESSSMQSYDLSVYRRTD